MLRVLIVDDRPENREALRTLLQGGAWAVDEASDGAEALALARVTPPDLVCTDVMMPVMSGFTFLQHWQADASLRSIPVIVRPTAFTTADAERRALELGAAAFIADGAEPGDLVALMDDLVTSGAPARPTDWRYPTGEAAPASLPYEEGLVRELEGMANEATLLRRELDAREAQLREVQSQLLQAQKAESLGQLASGIAHDFNNLLTVINGTADLALLSVDEGSPLRADLEDILAAGQRATALTAQLAAFSRKQEATIEAVDVNALLSGMESMLRRLIAADVELVIETRADTGVVMADPGRLGQVIMNLAVNARDAMPHGGTLTLQTRSVEAATDPDAERHSIPAGSYLALTVCDTGVGMDANTRDRIFERFFTTKGPGIGTGLGLSTSRSIVEQFGGTIQVDSEPGHGSAFTVYLPCVPATAAGAGA